MSGMLASVRSLDEAHIVSNAGAEILDLKAPEQGALGAVSHDVVRSVVDIYKNKNLISATIGDLPMDERIIDMAINDMAKTDVDIVKVGIFNNILTEDLIKCFRKQSEQGVRIVLVFFADEIMDMEAIFESIDSNIIYGVMLDTANKQSGSLLKHKTTVELGQFVTMSADNNLISGLAGSLKIGDINSLLDLRADYLGFRGALCDQSRRTSSIDELSVYRVRSKIPQSTLNLIDNKIELT